MSEPTLDEVALFVLQLEPDDREELGRVREQLADLTSGNRVAIASQPLVAGAVRALTRLVDGTAGDPAATLSEVGRLLQRALDVVPPFRAAAAVPAYGAASADVTGGTLPEDVNLDQLADFLAVSRDCLGGGVAALLALTSFAHGAEPLLARVREGAVAYNSACAGLALRSVNMRKALLDAVDAAAHAGGPGVALAPPDGYAALAQALAAYDGGTACDARTGEPPPEPPRVECCEGERRRGERGQAGTPAQGEQFLRVRTDRIDWLEELVSELVIAQAMIAGDETLAAAAGAHHELSKKIGHAGKIVRNLQELSTGMRIVPLRATFQKMARLVRDVSAGAGKPVDFVTEGDDTELDQILVDFVGDSLMHLLRNAIDHGTESPAERAAAGKPPRGTVRLSVYHAGGSVVVELADDGRGFDRERIVRKAVFTTADAVTDLSGRGVGMDVIWRDVEWVRGRVDIASRAGEGSTFTMRLPLTLAVTDRMLVRVGAERYVVPTTNVHVSFRPKPGAVWTIAERGGVVTLRGEAMPVVRLHRLFRVSGAEHDATRAARCGGRWAPASDGAARRRPTRPAAGRREVARRRGRPR